eukprot:407210_1
MTSNASELQKQEATFQSNPNPGKLNTSFWQKAFDKEEVAPKKDAPKKVNIYGKTFYDDKEAPKDEKPTLKPATVIITDAPKIDEDQKADMVEFRGKCIASGCKCPKYMENPSKWSKGKCKTCDHAPSTHKTQWVKPGCDPTSPKSPYSPYVKPTTPAKSMKPEPDTMENVWGQEFTDALKECVAKTFEYDAESILAAKYLLHFLKKRVGFSFAGQSQHRNALQYAFVELLGWRVVNQWGFNVRVIYED